MASFINNIIMYNKSGSNKIFETHVTTLEAKLTIQEWSVREMTISEWSVLQTTTTVMYNKPGSKRLVTFTNHSRT